MAISAFIKHTKALELDLFLQQLISLQGSLYVASTVRAFYSKSYVCEVEMTREGMHTTDGFFTPEHGTKTSVLF